MLFPVFQFVMYGNVVCWVSLMWRIRGSSVACFIVLNVAVVLSKNLNCMLVWSCCMLQFVAVANCRDFPEFLLLVGALKMVCRHVFRPCRLSPKTIEPFVLSLCCVLFVVQLIYCLTV